MNEGILLASDIDFMIHGIFKVKVFGQEVWITDSHACILIVMAVMVIFAVIANRKLKHATEKPDTFQNIIELIVEKLDGMVDSTMGKWAPRFVNYISTIFIFILMSNISGLFGLRPPTADYGTTLALALITFFMIRFNKAKHQSLKEIWTGMCSPLPPWLPLWAPINIISEIAIPISLSLRLFANVLSGTVIMALVYGLLGVIATAWPAALHVYLICFRSNPDVCILYAHNDLCVTGVWRRLKCIFRMHFLRKSLPRKRNSHAICSLYQNKYLN